GQLQHLGSLNATSDLATWSLAGSRYQMVHLNESLRADRSSWRRWSSSSMRTVVAHYNRRNVGTAKQVQMWTLSSCSGRAPHERVHANIHPPRQANEHNECHC